MATSTRGGGGPKPSKYGQSPPLFAPSNLTKPKNKAAYTAAYTPRVAAPTVNQNDLDPVTGKAPVIPKGVKTPAQANAYMKRGQNATDAYFRAQGHTGSAGELAHHFYHTALDVAALATGAVGTQQVIRYKNGKPVLDQHGKPMMFAYGGVGVPFGPKGLLGGAAADVGRSAEGAIAHVEEAARNARAEGHGPVGGGGVRNAPRLKPGEITPETGGDVGRQVRQALRDAPKARTAKEAMIHQGRVERAIKVEDALKLGGSKGLAAAKGALKGKLSQPNFEGFKGFDPQTLEAMKNHLLEHPSLKPLEKVSAADVIDEASKGEVPTVSGQALLERAFGKEVGNEVKTAATRVKSLKKFGVDLANVPRSIMASTDLSAPLRQGLVLGATHPVLFSKQFAPMLKAAVSEPYFQHDIQDAIHEMPTYPLMEKGGLALTDIGRDAKHGAEALGMREEARMSNLAERILPKGLNFIRGSDRAFVGFLNKARADYFNKLVHEAAIQGRDVNDEEFLKSVARVVNTATGRGSVGRLQPHVATMNAFFFSPRLLASRLNLLNPVYYAKLDPFARKEALRQFLSLGITATTILGLAKLAGAKVSDDPRNANFGKIQIGNTRLDILGGFQQPIRLSAQLATNTVISSTTGKTMRLGSGYGASTRFDIFVRFLQSKASPLPSVLIDAMRGEDFTGKKLNIEDLSSWQRETISRVTPLIAQDLHDLYHDRGPAGLALAPLGLVGVGLQTYGPKAPKPTGRTGYGQRGSGGVSRYGQRSGGGASRYGQR